MTRIVMTRRGLAMTFDKPLPLIPKTVHVAVAPDGTETLLRKVRGSFPAAPGTGRATTLRAACSDWLDAGARIERRPA